MSEFLQNGSFELRFEGSLIILETMRKVCRELRAICEISWSSIKSHLTLEQFCQICGMILEYEVFKVI